MCFDIELFFFKKIKKLETLITLKDHHLRILCRIMCKSDCRSKGYKKRKEDSIKIYVANQRTNLWFLINALDETDCKHVPSPLRRET